MPQPTVDMSADKSTDRFTLPKASVFISKNGYKNRYGLPPDQSMIRVLAWTYEQQKELERSQQQQDQHQQHASTQYTYNRRHAAAVSYESTMATRNNTIIVDTTSTPPPPTIGTTVNHTHRHPPHIHTSYYSDRVAHNMIWPTNSSNNNSGHTYTSSYQQQRHRPGVEAEHKRAVRQASKEEEEERGRMMLLERHAREKERQAKVDEEEGRLMAEWPHGMMAGKMKVARAGGMKRCVGVGVGDEVM